MFVIEGEAPGLKHQVMKERVDIMKKSSQNQPTSQRSQKQPKRSQFQSVLKYVSTVAYLPLPNSNRGE